MSEQSKLVSRQELYEAVWAKPISTLAKEWNTNYAQIAAACDLMNIPRPGSGHWQSVARGYVINRESLAAPNQGEPTEMLLSPGGGRPGGRARAERERMKVRQRSVEQQIPSSRPEGCPTSLDRPKTVDIEKAAEGVVLDTIRQARKIDFWSNKIGRFCYVSGLRDLLGVDNEIKMPDAKLVKAVKDLRENFGTFEVKVQDKHERYGRGVEGLEIEIHLRDECEWKDAWEEAWSFAGRPNDHCLSDNALRLYLWAKGPKNTGNAVDQNKIAGQAKLRDTYSYIDDHLCEIRLKIEPGIRWERVEGKGWRSPLRVWFEARGPSYYHYGPINPSLGLDVSQVAHAELERFRTWLYAEILKPEFPDGTETVGIFDLRTRKALKLAFDRLPASCGAYGDLPDFFKAVRLIDGMDLRCRFDDGGGPWLVVCQPEAGSSWRAMKAKLVAKAADIPLGKKYKLSRDGLALLKWITELRSDEYSNGMTPPVEDLLETDIGIEAEWDQGNSRALVEVIIEEINEHTDLRLRAVPWNECGKVHTRILVKKKESSADAVVRTIQTFGLTRNKLLSYDEVIGAINRLTSGD